jgi:hypothetical protein
MTIARSLTRALEFSSHLPEFGAAVSVNDGLIQSSTRTRPGSIHGSGHGGRDLLR